MDQAVLVGVLDAGTDLDDQFDQGFQVLRVACQSGSNTLRAISRSGSSKIRQP
jgi:hypothetical protein